MLRLLVWSAVDRSQFSHNKNIAKIYEFAVVRKPFKSFCISVCPECMMFFFLILIKRTCKVTTEVRITIRVKILNLYSRRWLFFISGIAGHENIDMILNHLQKFNPTQRFRPALSLGGSFANLRTMMSKAGR